MIDDFLFKIDCTSENVNNKNPLIYVLNGNIDEDATSKPSQDRPAILKQKIKRYHEKGNDVKYIPGKISDTLRKALGLRTLDVPLHVYRMRHLGYPPGWLKKAAVQKDNISITGLNAVVNKSMDNSVKYDWEKLHKFPGFNTFNNYDQRYDQCHELGFMPIQENSLLENFMSFLSSQHMLGKEAVNMKDIRSRNVIYSDTDFNLPITPVSKPIANSTPSNIKDTRTRDSSNMDISEGEIENDNEDDDIEIIEDPFIKSEKSLNKIHNGTFLLIPSANKPNLNKFSEGINEHRLFENLPNAGGSYKKVLNVLKRNQN